MSILATPARNPADVSRGKDIGHNTTHRNRQTRLGLKTPGAICHCLIRADIISASRFLIRGCCRSRGIRRSLARHVETLRSFKIPDRSGLPGRKVCLDQEHGNRISIMPGGMAGVNPVAMLQRLARVKQRGLDLPAASVRTRIFPAGRDHGPGFAGNQLALFPFCIGNLHLDNSIWDFFAEP